MNNLVNPGTFQATYSFAKSSPNQGIVAISKLASQDLMAAALQKKLLK
jgi:hypothetical protein